MDDEHSDVILADLARAAASLAATVNRLTLAFEGRQPNHGAPTPAVDLRSVPAPPQTSRKTVVAPRVSDSRRFKVPNPDSVRGRFFAAADEAVASRPDHPLLSPDSKIRCEAAGYIATSIGQPAMEVQTLRKYSREYAKFRGTAAAGR